MRTIFSILLIFLFSMSCFSQKGSVVPLREYAISKIKKRNEFVKKYADSLNEFKYSDETGVPVFFLKYDFDNEYGEYSINVEDETSLRKLIIDKIDNIALLRVVVDSKDKRLFKTVKHKHSMMHNLFGITAFIDYSTHELVRYRLEELINDMHSGKNAPNYPDDN